MVSHYFLVLISLLSSGIEHHSTHFLTICITGEMPIAVSCPVLHNLVWFPLAGELDVLLLTISDQMCGFQIFSSVLYPAFYSVYFDAQFKKF